MLSKKIKQGLYSVIDILLPKECINCGHADKWICAVCIRTLVINDTHPCIYCFKPTEYGTIHHECSRGVIDGLVIALKHTELLKELVHHFKYEHLPVLAAPFAEALNQKIHGSLIMHMMLMNKETLLVPMPLYHKREWDRGYNHAALLAGELERSWSAVSYMDIVARTKNTKTQTDLPRYKRLNNMKNAFHVAYPEYVNQKKIILIDDILTTGATMIEAARTLKQVGAQEVWGLVLARGK